MTWAWTDTSRAETGSSHTSRRGPHGQGSVDGNTLPLAPGEVFRILPNSRWIKTDHSHKLARPVTSSGCGSLESVNQHALGDELLSCHARIETGVRVLEDHLDFASETLQFRPLGPEDVNAVIGDLTVGPVARDA